MSIEPFNPLDIESLADSIISRLVRVPPVPMGKIPRFEGAGIYAIYYTGDFPCYELLSLHNVGDAWRMPIYVGKAAPKGGRQGIIQSSPSDTSLWSRLKQHAKSVEDVSNLNLEDFYARWLVVDDIWIALGESALLRNMRPLWNAKVDGFGNHDPGSGRHSGLVSSWDVLHPGRPWAAKLRQREPGTAEAIADGVARYLREQEHQL